MEKRIRTVLGDIPAENLGYCDCHCHPLVLSKHLMELDSDMFDVQDYAVAIRELDDFRRAGGEAIVDAQPIGTGRASEELVRIAKDTELNVIAGTGFHMQTFYPTHHWTFSATEKELTDIYIAEITHGMYVHTEDEYPGRQIDAKAGYLKNATEVPDFDEIDRKRLRAVANASIQTGAPLLCHTNGSALTHIPYLLELGVDPQSIIVAHLDKCTRPAEEYHLRIADMGVYLEFDGLVDRKYSQDWELTLIQEVLSRGYGDQLMFGSDPIRTAFKTYGGRGLDYIPLGFTCKLIEAGITQAQIHNMTTIVPSQAFSFK